MGRILYFVPSNGGITGGQKMALRHIETLREIGYDAYCYLSNLAPALIDHDCPVVRGEIHPDDIVVAPDDIPALIQLCAAKRWRTILFSQNPYNRTAETLGAIDVLGRVGQLKFLAVTERMGVSLNRLFPGSDVKVVRAFADERRFRPLPDKRQEIAFIPRKRPQEAEAIGAIFKHLYPAHGDFGWTRIEQASEMEVAALFGRSAIFLSLSRLESLGITPLEAMAAGCVCAGFTGIGGDAFATPENGFWVRDDDCEAAADALAEACALIKEGGKRLERVKQAGFETGRSWSHAVMKRQLAEAWGHLGPEYRLRTISAGV